MANTSLLAAVKFMCFNLHINWQLWVILTMVISECERVIRDVC